MRYLTVAVLYLIFSAAAGLAGLAGLVGLCLGKTEYISNVSRAMDSLLAALLGWDGRSTVSKECGRSNCRFCLILCAVLDVVLKKGHCKEEAQ